MKTIKPVWISILTIVVFVGALAIGMTTNWWQTSGRKTPLDSEIGGSETHDESEESEKTEIKGSSVVMDAVNLGLSIEEIERVMNGPIEDMNIAIKELSESRGLKFGEVKDELNSMLK